MEMMLVDLVIDYSYCDVVF